MRCDYALSLCALSRVPRWEAGTALAKGGIILVFGIAVVFEIVNKVVNGVPLSSTLMLAFGSAALITNLTCLALLWRFRSENVNISSTFECSRDDVASNVGVLVAAGLMAITGAAWPDIAVGGVIALIFLRSAWRVLAEAIPGVARSATDGAGSLAMIAAVSRAIAKTIPTSASLLRTDLCDAY